jgi:hypothetical protein
VVSELSSVAWFESLFASPLLFRLVFLIQLVEGPLQRYLYFQALTPVLGSTPVRLLRLVSSALLLQLLVLLWIRKFSDLLLALVDPLVILALGVRSRIDQYAVVLLLGMAVLVDLNVVDSTTCLGNM